MQSFNNMHAKLSSGTENKKNPNGSKIYAVNMIVVFRVFGRINKFSILNIFLV